MSYKIPPPPCPEKPEPFIPGRCAEAVIELRDGLLSEPPKPPTPGKKRLNRVGCGMQFGCEVFEDCFPCPKPGTLDPGTALAISMMIDALMCCFPYELSPNNCTGQIAREVKTGDNFWQGHPAVTGGVSKVGKECADYAAAFPEMAPMLGAMTNLYGHNSMPYLDWDCMNLRGVEKMLQLFAHMRDTLRYYAEMELAGTP